jgi:hypothetical protein
MCNTCGTECFRSFCTTGVAFPVPSLHTVHMATTTHTTHAAAEAARVRGFIAQDLEAAQAASAAGRHNDAAVLLSQVSNLQGALARLEAQL